MGAWCRAVHCLHRLAEARDRRLDKEFHEAAWTERSFGNFYASRISVALHISVARMLLEGARFMDRDIGVSRPRKGAGRRGA